MLLVIIMCCFAASPIVTKSQIPADSKGVPDRTLNTIWADVSYPLQPPTGFGSISWSRKQVISRQRFQISMRMTVLSYSLQKNQHRVLIGH